MDIPLHMYIIALGIVTSLIFNIQNRKSKFYLKSFPVYLTITLATDVIGNYMGENNISTTVLYNTYGLFSFTFLFVVLRSIIQSLTVKRIITAIILIYPVLFFINISYYQPFKFSSITHALGCLLISAICIYYFFELFQTPTSINLTREPGFYICVGLLFFYCCTFPFFGMANFMADLPKVILNNVEVLVRLMNVLLYSLFTIAFLCRIRIRRFT